MLRFLKCLGLLAAVTACGAAPIKGEGLKEGVHTSSAIARPERVVAMRQEVDALLLYERREITPLLEDFYKNIHPLQEKMETQLDAAAQLCGSTYRSEHVLTEAERAWCTVQIVELNSEMFQFVGLFVDNMFKQRAAYEKWLKMKPLISLLTEERGDRAKYGVTFGHEKLMKEELVRLLRAPHNFQKNVGNVAEWQSAVDLYGELLVERAAFVDDISEEWRAMQVQLAHSFHAVLELRFIIEPSIAELKGVMRRGSGK